jgi:hypothetical protein
VQVSVRLRRYLCTALLVVALPVSGCASGFGSPVLQDYNPAVGVNVRDGDVWAMNMLVVLPESGRGTLVGALLNKTPRADTLVGATVQSEPEEAPIQSTMVRPSVPLPPERLVNLSDTPTVAVEGDVTPGRFVNLTLQFESAEQVQVKVPVLAPTGPYADVPLP